MPGLLTDVNALQNILRVWLKPADETHTCSHAVNFLSERNVNVMYFKFMKYSFQISWASEWEVLFCYRRNDNYFMDSVHQLEVRKTTIK